MALGFYQSIMKD
jgi:hypothetical protein